MNTKNSKYIHILNFTIFLIIKYVFIMQLVNITHMLYYFTHIIERQQFVSFIYIFA